MEVGEHPSHALSLSLSLHPSLPPSLSPPLYVFILPSPKSIIFHPCPFHTYTYMHTYTNTYPHTLHMYNAHTYIPSPIFSSTSKFLATSGTLLCRYATPDTPTRTTGHKRCFNLKKKTMPNKGVKACIVKVA